jgi:putative toxin-antitoxin system antitoxin component (TIGR02293 family)
MTAAIDINGFLGVSDGNSPAARISLLRSGLPYQSLERIQEALGLSLEELAAALGISTRTLNRRKEQDSLQQDESDRVFRIARVFTHALAVFGSPEKSARWFKRENPALDAMRPLDIFDTDMGAQMVDDLLTRIEYGVYS